MDRTHLISLNKSYKKSSNDEAARLKNLNCHFNSNESVQPFIDMGQQDWPHAFSWMTRDGVGFLCCIGFYGIHSEHLISVVNRIRARPHDLSGVLVWWQPRAQCLNSLCLNDSTSFSEMTRQMAFRKKCQRVLQGGQLYLVFLVSTQLQVVSIHVICSM